MKRRDELKLRSKSTNDNDYWENWKRMKNEVNRAIRKEKSKSKDNEIKVVSEDITAKSLCNYVKRKAC